MLLRTSADEAGFAALQDVVCLLLSEGTLLDAAAAGNTTWRSEPDD